MIRLMRRYFRPVLEWLEARFAPASVAPVALVQAPPVPPPPIVDVSVSDAVFSGPDVHLLPYFNDALSAPGLASAAQEVSDAVFSGGFSYYDADTSTAVTDAVFAQTLGPIGATQFDFLPPPAPKSLPPTQMGAHGSMPLVLELANLGELPPPADDDASAPDDLAILSDEEALAVA